MAPTRARAKPSASKSSKSKSQSRKGHSTRTAGSSSKKPSTKSKSSRVPSGREVKALPSSLTSSHKDRHKQKQKKKRTYTDKELGITPLNKITPAGVRKPTSGKQRGKVFVDDAESMRRIWAIVRAEKDKDVEGKVQRERQLEEVREARRVEMERKEEARRAKLEETKDSLRNQRKKNKAGPILTHDDVDDDTAELPKFKAKKSNTKRVSFA